jgi:serine protease inhibitor ecotin
MKCIRFLITFFLVFSIVGCENKDKVIREEAADKAKVEMENANAAAEDILRQRIQSACKAGVQSWLNGWGNGDKVLDWVDDNVSLRYSITKTSTGYRYYVGRAKISGHNSTLVSECFTDSAGAIIDLQSKWAY